MSYKHSHWLLLLLAHCVLNAATTAPTIATKYGLLQGETVKASYHAYRSIPYAQAPLNAQRFEPPLPLAHNWTGVLQATRHAPKCLQWNSLHDGEPIVGSEDCLYLNIFVPITGDRRHKQRLLPVMVFIHGGGLMWGAADFYGEEQLMQHGGLILVTLNYRLGPFGFLSTEDAQIAGNMGFKDQSLALQFVYENIAQFGGNRAQILLAGWSAGGASVHFHMVSALTEAAWFHSALSFSGTALCPCHAIYAGEALEKAQLLAKYLNCSVAAQAHTHGIKACLQSKSAREIIEQVPKFYKFGKHPFAIFGPVIERVENGKSFLDAQVEQLMRTGRTKTKPWLLARTAEDGAFGTAEFLRRDANGLELIYALNEHWNEWAPVMLFFNASWTQEERVKLAADLRRQYFGERNIDLQSYAALERLYNEELSNKHVQRVAELYVNFTANASAYGYVYDNPAPYGLGNMLAARDNWQFGTLHGDDIFLIFKTPVRAQHPLRADEKLIAEALMEMLVQMASTGVPSYKGVPLQKLSVENNFQFTVIKD